MNKSEINEIKNLFRSVDDLGAERLCGCYVDGDKNIISQFSLSFLNIERDEKHKYVEIFKKALSGVQGKNLLDMSFTQETDGNKLLESMRRAQLKDDSLNQLFFDKIIETYDYVGPYLILVIYQAYDVPGITDDKIKMDDASEEVYSYILCCMCPIAVTKPGLGYYEETNDFHTLRQDKYVKLPENAFLYPAFNDRSTDTDAILYYTQKGANAEAALLNDFLGVKAPIPAVEQKEIFQNLVMEAVGEDTDVETITAIHENLAEMVSEKKEREETGRAVVIDKEDVAAVLKKSGIEEHKIADFRQNFEEVFDADDGRQELFAENIIPARAKLEMKTPDVVVKINYDKTSLVKTQIIDGKKCLVIELGEGLVVNGIPV